MSGALISPFLVRAHRLTRELLSAAELGDVEDMPALDAERLLLLQNFLDFRRTLNPEERDCIADIERMNERSIAALSAREGLLACELQTLSTGRRAVDAYATVQKPGRSE